MKNPVLGFFSQFVCLWGALSYKFNKGFEQISACNTGIWTLNWTAHNEECTNEKWWRSQLVTHTMETYLRIASRVSIFGSARVPFEVCSFVSKALHIWDIATFHFNLKIAFWHESCLWAPNLVIVKTIEGSSIINVKYEFLFYQWKLRFQPWGGNCWVLHKLNLC